MAKYIAKAQNTLPPVAEKASADSPPVFSSNALPELDVENLLAKAGVILQREISNLMVESSGKKLTPASARDLTAYIKLLSELKAEQLKELQNLTDEELAAKLLKK